MFMVIKFLNFFFYWLLFVAVFLYYSIVDGLVALLNLRTGNDLWDDSLLSMMSYTNRCFDKLDTRQLLALKLAEEKSLFVNCIKSNIGALVSTRYQSGRSYCEVAVLLNKAEIAAP